MGTVKSESGEGHTREVRLYLERVHCSDCVRDLMETVAARIDGVAGVRFEHADLCLVVEAERQFDESEIRAVIQDLGYSFREPGSKAGRSSAAANALYIAVAVILLAALIVWLRTL